MWKRGLLVFVIFLCLVLLFFYPLLKNFTTHTTSVHDGQLITWLVHQSANAWSGEGEWYNWPFFYPYRFTATFSDPFVTSGVLLLVIRKYTDNFVVQHNLLLMLGLCGNFWGMFLLGKKLWKDTFAALVSALVFAFSYQQYQFIPHLHTYMLFGLPLGLWALISYLETRKKIYAVSMGFFFVLQALNAPMTGYFFIAIITIYIFCEAKFLVLIKDTFFTSVSLISLAICAWYYLPYVFTAQDLQAVRTIRDTAHFSYPLEKLFSPDIFVPLCIFILSWTKAQRKIITSSNRFKISPKTIFFIIVAGAVCMLGPVIKIGSETFKIFELPIPLPYAVLYYVIPGIQAFRAVSRWAVVLNFGLAIGLGWIITQNVKKSIVMLGLGLYLLGNFWLTSLHQYLYPVSTETPEIYTLVQESDKKVLAEFPMYQWDMGEVAGHENQRLSYQLYHKKTLYNGVSGIMPPKRSLDILTHFKYFPEEKSLELLKDDRVELVLVHLDEYEELYKQKITYSTLVSESSVEMEEKLQMSSELELIGCTADPDNCLYVFK